MSETFFGKWKFLKKNEKYFLIDRKVSFHSQDSQISVLTFWSSTKNAFLRKKGLFPKRMMSQAS